MPALLPSIHTIAQQQPGHGSVVMWELVIPGIILALTLIIILVISGAAVRRRRALLAAFDRLADSGGLEPVRDPDRREELGQYLYGLATGRFDMLRQSTANLLPVDRAIEHKADAFTVTVLYHANGSQRGGGITDTELTVVVGDGFDVELPPFKLAPGTAMPTGRDQPRVFAPQVGFGRHNQVFSDQPQRVRALLRGEIETLLTPNDAIAIESVDNKLMIYRHDRPLRAAELQPFIEDCMVMMHAILDNAAKASAEATDV